MYSIHETLSGYLTGQGYQSPCVCDELSRAAAHQLSLGRSITIHGAKCQSVRIDHVDGTDIWTVTDGNDVEEFGFAESAAHNAAWRISQYE